MGRVVVGRFQRRVGGNLTLRCPPRLSNHHHQYLPPPHPHCCAALQYFPFFFAKPREGCCKSCGYRSNCCDLLIGKHYKPTTLHFYLLLNFHCVKGSKKKLYLSAYFQSLSAVFFFFLKFHCQWLWLTFH